MRLGHLSVAAATAPCVWLAACASAQDTAGNAAHQQQHTDADVTPGGGEGDEGRGNAKLILLEVALSAEDSSCGPSVLYNRTIDPSQYTFGCPEIEVSRVLVPKGALPPASMTFGHS